MHNYAIDLNNMQADPVSSGKSTVFIFHVVFTEENI